MANYTINTAGSTTCNYPSTVNANDVLTFNITNKNTTTKYQGSMLTYTFPCDCTAEILAAGAKGGNGAGSGTGGRGAIVAGTISFKTGDQLLICVGQAGTNNTTTSGSDGTTGAGGGGTYVVRKVSSSSYRYTGSGTGNNWYVEPLVIAAGGNGGGDNLYTGNSTAVHGSSNQGNENNMSYSSSTYYGGGFSKCSTSTDTSSGRSFLTGATGATESYIRNNYTSYAGFGGGGAARDDGTCGGGGGGYTGGSQSGATAATSFVITIASNISRKSGDTGGNNGEGYVKITFKTVVPPHEFPEDQVVTTTGFNAKVKTNNSWKDGTKGYVKVNNVWKEINKMYTKVNNQWVLTGEEKKYTVKSLIDEGFVNPNTQLGEYNGTATYSAYTAGTGVKLYVASSSYPTAVGNFKTNTNALKDLKSITFDFTRTSGNTNFNIGIFVSSTAQSGRLNSTNTNNLIKAYKTFNAASGSVTIDLEEAFGSNLNTYINSNYYIGFYLNCSASTTVVIKNATIDIPYSNIIKVLDNGTLNASTALGDYKSIVSYSKYTAGTGITLYKNTSDIYPYSVGTFEGNSDILSKVKSITFDYNRTAGSGNFELGIFYVSSIKNGRLTDNSTLTYYKTKTVTSNTGTVTFDLSELGSTNNNYYLGILFYQTGTVSNTVVIKNVSYIEKDAVSVPSNGPIGTELGLGFYDMNTPFAWTKDANILSSGKILLKDVYNQYGENVKFTLTSTANDLLNMKVLQGKYYATINGTENGIANAGPIYFFFENDDTDQTITKNLIHTKNTVSFTISLSEFTSKMGGVSYEYFFITLESVFGVSALSNYKLTIESASGGETYQDLVLLRNGTMQNIDVIGGIKSGTSATYTEGTGITLSSYNSRYYKFTFSNKIDLTNYKYATMTFKNGSTTSDLTAQFGFFKDTIASNSWTTTPFSSNWATTDGTTTLNRGQQETITVSIDNFTGSNYFGIFNYQTSGSSSSSGSIIITDIILTNTLPDESGGETQTATLRLSSMIPVSAYDSTWNNASYAYDTSSTTYADLSLTSVMTNEQQLKFAIDTALLNVINSVTKATLKMKMRYVLNSGSDPNVGVMLKNKAGNSMYYDENFDESTSESNVLTIDVTNHISSSIDNGMILYGLYTSNLYSGAKGQVRLYEAYIELEYGGSGSGGGTTTPNGGSGQIPLKKGGYDQYGNFNTTSYRNCITTDKLSVNQYFNNNDTITITYDITNVTASPFYLVIDVWMIDNGGHIGNFSEYYVYPPKTSLEISLSKLAEFVDTIPQFIGEVAFTIGLESSINLNLSDFTLTYTQGGTGTSGISFRQGYIDPTDGEYVPADNYESIVTDKVSVKSMSNTSTISFTVTSSTSISAKAYFEVWSSDGTQGNFIGYIDLNGYAFSAYQSVIISLTKNEIAYDLNAGSGYDIGHVALSLYADTIYAENFTVSTNANDSGVMPIDDI